MQTKKQGRLTFIVKQESLNWSDVFIKIQTLQKQYKHFVTDITVNETSLEEIFLQFANTKAQHTNNVGVEAVSVWTTLNLNYERKIDRRRVHWVEDRKGTISEWFFSVVLSKVANSHKNKGNTNDGSYTNPWQIINYSIYCCCVLMLYIVCLRFKMHPKM